MSDIRLRQKVTVERLLVREGEPPRLVTYWLDENGECFARQDPFDEVPDADPRRMQRLIAAGVVS